MKIVLETNIDILMSFYSHWKKYPNRSKCPSFCDLIKSLMVLLLQTFHFWHCKFRGCDLGFRTDCQCFTFGLCRAALSYRSVAALVNRAAVFEVALTDFRQVNGVRERWFLNAVSFVFDYHGLLSSQCLSLVFNFVFNDTLGGSSDDAWLVTY